MCLLVWLPAVLYIMSMDCTVRYVWAAEYLNVHTYNTHMYGSLGINDNLSLDTRAASRSFFLSIL